MTYKVAKSKIKEATLTSLFDITTDKKLDGGIFVLQRTNNFPNYKKQYVGTWSDEHCCYTHKLLGKLDTSLVTVVYASMLYKIEMLEGKMQTTDLLETITFKTLHELKASL